MNEITIHQQNAITIPQDLAPLIPEWENELRARVAAQEISEDTAKGYKAGCVRFMSWLREAGERPDPDGIRQWKSELLTRYKPAAVNAWLSGVRSFFTWLAEKGEIPFNPTQAIKSAKRKSSKKHSRQPLTDAEVKALLLQPDKTTPEGCRDYAMLALMLYTAARTIELYRADFEDLQSTGSQLIIYVQGKGKTEKDEYLVIHSAAETAMLEWIAQRGKKPGPLFTSFSDRSEGGRLSRRSIRGIIKSYFTKAGIHSERKTTHSLRHTAITKALKNSGNDVVKVQGMSRHSSIDTLMIYAHENEREKDPAEKYIEY
jgi:integrase/recombinase XerD